MIQKLVQKFKRNADDYGMGVALRKAAFYVVSPVYEARVYRIYRINLERISGNGCAESETFRIQFLQPDDQAWIRQIERHAEWLQGTLYDRLNQGAMCLVAFDQSELAGFNLVSFDMIRIPLIHIDRRLRPHEAWSSQITVFKRFRQRGLASALRYHVFDELRRRKIRKLYGGTLVDNLAAMKLAKHVGFDELVDIRYSRILWRKQWSYDRVAGCG